LLAAAALVAAGCAASMVPASASPAVSVASVTPPTGPVVGGGHVVIAGSGFDATAIVTIGGTVSSAVTVVSSTVLTATVPAGVGGAVDVKVTDAAGTATLSGGYTYVAAPFGPPPTVASLSSTVWANPASTPIVITGANFAASAQVLVAGVPAGSVTVTGPTSLSFIPPALPAGTVQVAITNPDGQEATTSLSIGLAISGTYPSNISAGSGFINNGVSTSTGTSLITVTGNGFGPGIVVTLFGQPLTKVKVISPTVLTGVTPAALAGSDQLVATLGALVSPPLLVNVVPAGAAPSTVTGVTPASGVPGTVVALVGQNFDQYTQVYFDGVPATAITRNSATSMSVIVPSHAVGPVDLALTNGGGTTATLANGFAVVGDNASATATFSATLPPGPCVVLVSGTSVSFGPVAAGVTTPSTGNVSTAIQNCSTPAQTEVLYGTVSPASNGIGGTVSPAVGTATVPGTDEFRYAFGYTNSANQSVSTAANGTALTQLLTIPASAAPTSLTHSLQLGSINAGNIGTTFSVNILFTATF
jgi:hypothetical protein